MEKTEKERLTQKLQMYTNLAWQSLTKHHIEITLVPFVGQIVAFETKVQHLCQPEDLHRIGGVSFGYICPRRKNPITLLRFITPKASSQVCALSPTWKPNMLQCWNDEGQDYQDCAIKLRLATCEERAALKSAYMAETVRLDFQWCLECLDHLPGQRNCFRRTLPW